MHDVSFIKLILVDSTYNVNVAGDILGLTTPKYFPDYVFSLFETLLKASPLFFILFAASFLWSVVKLINNKFQRGENIKGPGVPAQKTFPRLILQLLPYSFTLASGVALYLHLYSSFEYALLAFVIAFFIPSLLVRAIGIKKDA